MIRPEHLPDFKTPPLNEAVIGVQFSSPRGYQQIRAYEVWQLYRREFPNVEELPPLLPSFETFGLPIGPQFNLVTGAQHDRFWFLSPKKDELIQFQGDRLIHNWRKVGDQRNEYPRFEKMIVRFEEELRKLEVYFNSLSPQSVVITQCEISYVNHINLDGPDGTLAISDLLRFMQVPGEQPEDFTFVFRRPIYNESKAPIGRLICEAQTVVHAASGKRIVQFTITARGAPAEPTIATALEFLKAGRELVVNTFADMTTDLGHRIWGRVK